MVKTESTVVSAKASSVAPRKLENTTASVPIVYGSIAFYLGKKADEFNTHQWTLYLRGSNNEDLSTVISKVVFHLHPSFAEPTREMTEPPYEVTERGWGEFEAQIRISWKDPKEKTTVLTHAIKLYPTGTKQQANVPVAPPADPSIPVVAEKYDEVVFTDPRDTFFECMQNLQHTEAPEYSQQAHFQQFADADDFNALIGAHRLIQEELQRAKERLEIVDSEMAEIDEKVNDFQVRSAHRSRAPSTASSRSKA